MKIRSALALVSLAALCGCDSKPQAPASSGAADGTYLGTVTKAQKTAVKAIDTASLNSAIQMFYVAEGRYPNDLNELVAKKHLPEMPQPPHGMKFEYDAKNGTVKVVPQ